VIDDAHLVGFGIARAKADLGFFGKFHKTILTRAGRAGGGRSWNRTSNFSEKRKAPAFLLIVGIHR
jgi:hypothetical protein